MTTPPSNQYIDDSRHISSKNEVDPNNATTVVPSPATLKKGLKPYSTTKTTTK
jgi:hypothetical protein